MGDAPSAATVIVTAAWTSSLCLVALASARQAVVLRSRRAVAARLFVRAGPGDTAQRRPPISVTVAVICVAASGLGALLGGGRLALVAAGAVAAGWEVTRRSQRSRSARRYE